MGRSRWSPRPRQHAPAQPCYGACSRAPTNLHTHPWTCTHVALSPLPWEHGLLPCLRPQRAQLLAHWHAWLCTSITPLRPSCSYTHMHSTTTRTPAHERLRRAPPLATAVGRAHTHGGQVPVRPHEHKLEPLAFSNKWPRSHAPPWPCSAPARPLPCYHSHPLPWTMV